jgi:hypothetical protein
MPLVVGNSFFRVLGQISKRTLVDTARVTAGSGLVFGGYHLYGKFSQEKVLNIKPVQDKPLNVKPPEPLKEVDHYERLLTLG